MPTTIANSSAKKVSSTVIGRRSTRMVVTGRPSWIEVPRSPWASRRGRSRTGPGSAGPGRSGARSRRTCAAVAARRAPPRTGRPGEPRQREDEEDDPEQDRDAEQEPPDDEAQSSCSSRYGCVRAGYDEGAPPVGRRPSRSVGQPSRLGAAGGGLRNPPKRPRQYSNVTGAGRCGAGSSASHWSRERVDDVVGVEGRAVVELDALAELAGPDRQRRRSASQLGRQRRAPASVPPTL